MASRRLQVLAFVRDYIGHWGVSPSYGEIAGKLGVDRSRARDLVRSLVRDGLLLRRPGPRGLMMPQEQAAALRVLRALGWAIDEDRAALVAPASTNPPLLPPPAPGYFTDDLAGDEGGDSGG